jgi:hypothetical protein
MRSLSTAREKMLCSSPTRLRTVLGDDPPVRGYGVAQRDLDAAFHRDFSQLSSRVAQSPFAGGFMSPRNLALTTNVDMFLTAPCLIFCARS